MYTLILIDTNGRTFDVYSSKKIFDIDCITGEFLDKEDLLEKMSKNSNRQLIDVVIKSKFNNKEKFIRDIMYSNYIIPERDFLEDKYAKFLFGDREQIRKSFIYHLPKFKNRNLDNITYFDIVDALSNYMVGYGTLRRCYFHLIDYGKIKINKSESKVDYLKNTIENVDTDELTDQDIMIEKIKNGEIEPNFYDIDDYSSMKRRRR